MEKYGNTDTTLDDRGEKEKAIYHGVDVISSMSQVNINELIDRVGKEIPSTDRKRARDRVTMINWENVAFEAYGANECSLAWKYLMSNTRKYRTIDEVVAEIKSAMKTKVSRQIFLDYSDQPPQPPKFRSASDIFVREKWREYVAEFSHSNVTMMNFMKFQTIAGKQHAELSEEEKEAYKKKFKMISTEYDKKLEEFYDRFPNKNQTIKRVNQDAPRPPRTAKSYFLQAKLQKLELPPQELSALKAKYLKKYQKLSDKKKAKWIDCTIDHCEKYETDLKEYISSHPEYIPPTFKIKNVLKNYELEIWENLRDKPRAPTTKYCLFVDSFLENQEFDGLSLIERRSLAKKAFQKLTWYGKEQVEIHFNLALMNYKQNLQEYYDGLPVVIKPIVLESIPKKFRTFLEQVDQTQFSENDDELDIKTEMSPNSTEGSNQIEMKSKKRKKSSIAVEESCTEEIFEGVTDYETDNMYSERTLKKKKKKKRKNNSEVKYSKEPEEIGDIMEDVNNFEMQPYAKTNEESSEETHTQCKVEKKRKIKKTIVAETLENNVITVAHQLSQTNTTN